MAPPRRRSIARPEVVTQIKAIGQGAVQEIKQSADAAFGVSKPRVAPQDDFDFTQDAAFIEDTQGDDYSFTEEEVYGTQVQRIYGVPVGDTDPKTSPYAYDPSVVLTAQEQKDAAAISQDAAAHNSELAYEFSDRAINEDEVQLFSATGGVESSKYAKVLFSGNKGSVVALSDAYMSRVELIEVIEERFKRPRARIIFDFNSPIIQHNPPAEEGKVLSSIDNLIEQIPLDTKMFIDIGYVNQYVRYGEFEVIQHDVVFNDGGISVTVNLESYARMRHYTGYRVFTKGSVIDVVRELANRGGIQVDEASWTSAFEALRNGSPFEPDIERLLAIDPNDPFVQTGESDLAAITALLRRYGLAFTQRNGMMSVIPLFSPKRGAYITLKHGGWGANVTKISFKAKKPRVNFIREVVAAARLAARVAPKKAKSFGISPKAPPLSQPTDAEVPPSDPGPAPDVNAYSTQIYNRLLSEWRTKKSAYEAYNQKIAQENSTITLSTTEGDAVEVTTATNASGTTEEEKAPAANNTTTKSGNTNRQQGRVLGRIRRQGRILSGSVDLLTGSVVVTLAQEVRISVGSKLYDDLKFQIDMIKHTINDKGFDTSLNITAAKPKRAAAPKKTVVSGVPVFEAAPASQSAATQANARDTELQMVKSVYRSLEKPVEPNVAGMTQVQKALAQENYQKELANYNEQIKLVDDTLNRIGATRADIEGKP